ncbi:YceK/YidQ family lipoprotein [Testudinibacter sp. P27/CKL/0425]
MYKPLFIFLLGWLLSGCGTIVALINPSTPYSAYAGVKYDYRMAQQWGLPILDLPLSFILDTALLPYALTQASPQDAP